MLIETKFSVTITAPTGESKVELFEDLDSALAKCQDEEKRILAEGNVAGWSIDLDQISNLKSWLWI